MTPTFSGGIAYEFFEGPNRYGLVKFGKAAAAGSAKTQEGELRRPPPQQQQQQGQENGEDRLEPLDDFRNLKAKLHECESDVEAVMAMEPKDAIFGSRPWPPPQTKSWLADTVLPASPVDWDEVALQFEDRQWVDVQDEIEKDKDVNKKGEGEEEVASPSSATRGSFWHGLLPIRGAPKEA
jgi:hypothetical protein